MLLYCDEDQHCAFSATENEENLLKLQRLCVRLLSNACALDSAVQETEALLPQLHEYGSFLLKLFDGCLHQLHFKEDSHPAAAVGDGGGSSFEINANMAVMLQLIVMNINQMIIIMSGIPSKVASKQQHKVISSSDALLVETYSQLHCILSLLIGWNCSFVETAQRCLSESSHERMLLLRGDSTQQQWLSSTSCSFHTAIVEKKQHLIPQHFTCAALVGQESRVRSAFDDVVICLNSMPSTKTSTATELFWKGTEDLFVEVGRDSQQLVETLQSMQRQLLESNCIHAAVDALYGIYQHLQHSDVMCRNMVNMSYIHIAKCWNALPRCSLVDLLAAHGLLLTLPVDGYDMNQQQFQRKIMFPFQLLREQLQRCGKLTVMLQLHNAGFVALVPIAMHLLEHYDERVQCVGSVLLRRMIDNTAATLLDSVTSWITPRLEQLHKTMTTPWTKISFMRMFHSLLISNISSSFNEKHLQLYLMEMTNEIIQKKDSSILSAMLLQYQSFLAFTCPLAIIQVHLQQIIQGLCQVFEVLNYSLQMLGLDTLHLLCKRLHDQRPGLELYIVSIVEALLRLRLFYMTSLTDSNGIANAIANLDEIKLILKRIIFVGRELQTQPLIATALEHCFDDMLAHALQKEANNDSEEVNEWHISMAIEDFHQSLCASIKKEALVLCGDVYGVRCFIKETADEDEAKRLLSSFELVDGLVVAATSAAVASSSGSKCPPGFSYLAQAKDLADIVDPLPSDQMHLQFLNRAVGWGLFTTVMIPADSAVVMYSGEYIKSMEAERRHQCNQLHNQRTYILTVKEYLRESSEEQQVAALISNIDAAEVGGIARFINHSCDPNLEVRMFRHQGDVLAMPVLYSIRDIVPNEELTFSYAEDQVKNEKNSSSEENASRIQQHGATRCYCGAINCCGVLPSQLK